MGNKSSTTMNATMESVTNSMMSSLTSVSNDAKAVNSTNQTINFVNNGTIDCDAGFKVGNFAASVTDLTAVFSSDLSTNIISTMAASIDNATTSGTKSAQDFLATSVSIQQTNITVAQHIKNTITLNAVSILSNTCKAYSEMTQTLNFTNNGTIYASQCDFTNYAQISLITSCTMTAAVETLADSSQLAAVLSKLDAQSENDQKGAGGVLNNAINAIAKVVGGVTNAYALIVLGVLAVVGLAVFSFFAIFKPGKNGQANGNLTALTGLAGSAIGAKTGKKIDVPSSATALLDTKEE